MPAAGALPADIVVSDLNERALAGLAARFSGIAITTESAKAAGQKVVFFALPPSAMKEALPGIRTALPADAIVVSLAPKFTISKLTEMLGGFARIARVIPNAPSVIGAGYNPIVFSSVLTAADKAILAGLLRPLGELPEVAEEKLEAYAVLTAMGPTYLWFQIQALRELAATFGLDDAEIRPAMKSMVYGAVCTLFDAGLAPAAVMDLVAVKPLVEMEPIVSEFYHTRLPAIHRKIQP